MRCTSIYIFFLEWDSLEFRHKRLRKALCATGTRLANEFMSRMYVVDFVITEVWVKTILL